MEIPRLVTLANDIAANLAAGLAPDAAAAEIRRHMWLFWTPAMRQSLAAHARSGGAGLDPLAQSAALSLG